MAFSKRQQHRLLLIVAFIIVSYIASHYEPPETPPATDTTELVTSLYEQGRSDVQIEIHGHVSRILPDDTVGSQHQRFVVALGSGNTVLVAHNIDLAPRVADLNVGDEITIYGEYEWNNKGGVLHWTHHDPANTHPHGWIRHKGELYQ